jgi:DNA (cytosine-5)-methyltransferase 1
MRVLDLFSGIGGMSLGLSRAGMTTVAFCEINPFCRRVLAKHWPEVPIYDDVRSLTAARLAADGVLRPDGVAGGFPCQDISIAGPGGGLDGPRSGLWFEQRRIIEEVRPRWVLIENTPALRSRGLDRVLGGLDALGYDAIWDCVPAGAIGARHRRDRLFIVAYARGAGLAVSECEAVFGAGWREEGRAAAERAGWPCEPGVGRVVHGLSGRVERITGLGNAVVPQVVELIGRRIMQREGVAA